MRCRRRGGNGLGGLTGATTSLATQASNGHEQQGKSRTGTNGNPDNGTDAELRSRIGSVDEVLDAGGGTQPTIDVADIGQVGSGDPILSRAVARRRFEGTEVLKGTAGLEARPRPGLGTVARGVVRRDRPGIHIATFLRRQDAKDAPVIERHVGIDVAAVATCRVMRQRHGRVEQQLLDLRLLRRVLQYAAGGILSERIGILTSRFGRRTHLGIRTSSRGGRRDAVAREVVDGDAQLFGGHKLVAGRTVVGRQGTTIVGGACPRIGTSPQHDKGRHNFWLGWLFVVDVVFDVVVDGSGGESARENLLGLMTKTCVIRSL